MSFRCNEVKIFSVIFLIYEFISVAINFGNKIINRKKFTITLHINMQGINVSNKTISITYFKTTENCVNFIIFILIDNYKLFLYSNKEVLKQLNLSD